MTVDENGNSVDVSEAESVTAGVSVANAVEEAFLGTNNAVETLNEERSEVGFIGFVEEEILAVGTEVLVIVNVAF